MDNSDIKNKLEKDGKERKDPTSFLPEEPMSYEIKKKKKKKKKKMEDDPFKDVDETIIVPDGIVVPQHEIRPVLDPEVTIKVENIHCDLDFNDFMDNVDCLTETEGVNIQEPEVTLEEGSHEGAILTFENILNNKPKAEMTENGEEINTGPHVCKLCHLFFKNDRTLQTHQKRMHEVFRHSFIHTCDHCNMAYEFKSSLKTHIKRKHSQNAVEENEEKTCEICALVFKGTTRLRMHMRRKHGAFKESFKHVCKDCGLTYEKYSSLFVHRKRKHSKVSTVTEQWISCPCCPRVFNKRETYARHMQRKHLTENYVLKNNEEPSKSFRNEAGEVSCKECPLVFSSMSYLKTHMRRKHNAHTDTYRLKCKICNLSYDKIESLKRHVKRRHDQGSYCSQCCKQFSTRESYLNHSHAKVVKECTICGLIFASPKGLAKHMRCTHKVSSPNVAFCQVCGEGFHDKRQLKPHLLRVHYKVSYNCKFCKKDFKSRESYRKHILLKHPDGADSEMQKCEQCSETFEDEFDLCKHVNLAHRCVKTEQDPQIKIEAEEQDFQCIKCPDKYPSWDQLRTHYEQSHYKSISCQCQVCGEIVLVKELQKHIKLSHRQSEELKCRFCNFKTDAKVSLTQHMLRHKNASTLDCDFPNCRYKTFYEAAMAKHKRKHQTQGVKLQCSKCAFQTMNKYILKYHEEAHSTGKKKYSCNQCDYATTLPANLVQHKYKHSTEKRFKCEVCPFATKYNTSLRFHVKKKHCDLPSL